MAIATANLTYIGSGPTATGQICVQDGLSGDFARTLVGTVTFTGDGASTSATMNYIDGTAVLGFQPRGIVAFRSGGAATATIAPVSVVDAGDNGKTATVNFSAAVNAATIILTVLIFK